MTEHDGTRGAGPLTLAALTDELLAEAREHHSHRAARTVMSGAHMRATVIALLAGSELAEHEAPPAATLHVVHGDVELVAGERRVPMSAGQLVVIPQQRHSLEAHSDAVVLLTVALL